MKGPDAAFTTTIPLKEQIRKDWLFIPTTSSFGFGLGTWGVSFRCFSLLPCVVVGGCARAEGGEVPGRSSNGPFAVGTLSKLFLAPTPVVPCLFFLWPTPLTNHPHTDAATATAGAAMASAASPEEDTQAQAQAAQIELPAASEVLPTGEAVASKLEAATLQPPVMAAAKGVGVTLDPSPWPIVHGTRASSDHTPLRQPHGDPHERFFLFRSQVRRRGLCWLAGSATRIHMHKRASSSAYPPTVLPTCNSASKRTSRPVASTWASSSCRTSGTTPGAAKCRAKHAPGSMTRPARWWSSTWYVLLFF